MTIMDTTAALLRIKATPASRPLAVFAASKRGHLHCLPAHTLATAWLVASADPALIGIYHGEMAQDQTARHLDAVSRKAHDHPLTTERCLAAAEAGLRRLMHEHNITPALLQRQAG